MTFYYPFTESQKTELIAEYSKYIDNTIFVHCNRINGVQFYYECPFCFKVGNSTKYSQYKKNGKKYVSIKPNEHLHGSGFENHNRTESRSSHCSSKYHIDELFGSHQELELKKIRKKITQDEFDAIIEKKKEFYNELDKMVVIVIDDDTVRETTYEEQLVLAKKYNSRRC